MKVLLPLAQGFEEMEFSPVVRILRKADLEVTLAGVPGTIITGSGGVNLIADTKLEDVGTEDFDALVLVGGESYQSLSRSRKVLSAIKEFQSQNKLLAAIGTSPIVLAKAGVLDDKKATVFPGMEREIPKPRNGKIITDGKIITCGSPCDSIEFALKIVSNLTSEQQATKVKRQLKV